MHQYRLGGVPLGVFVTEDIGGARNILAPAPMRSAIAVRAAKFLLHDWGAHLAVLSLEDGAFRPAPGDFEQHWAFRRRTLLRRLPLQSSYQATLNTMGPHTRRNFRLFRRRALGAYDCTYVPQAGLSEGDFIALNALCDYPVPLKVAQWRYRSVHVVPGGVLAGVQARNGDWISMVGGRRSHGTFAIDWQMNRSDFKRISPATLLRGFLMEHEVGLGTASLLFQGGTPHSMQYAFQPESVVDLVASAASLPATLLRRIARHLRRPENFLVETLADKTLEWHAGVEA